MLQNIARRKYGNKYTGLNKEGIRRVLAKTDTDGTISLDKQEFYDLYKNLWF